MSRHTWHFRRYSAYPENLNTNNIFRFKKKGHLDGLDFCEKPKNIFWPHLRLWALLAWHDFFSKIGLRHFFILWLSTSMRACVRTHTHTHTHTHTQIGASTLRCYTGNRQMEEWNDRQSKIHMIFFGCQGVQ